MNSVKPSAKPLIHGLYRAKFTLPFFPAATNISSNNSLLSDGRPSSVVFYLLSGLHCTPTPPTRSLGPNVYSSHSGTVSMRPGSFTTILSTKVKATKPVAICAIDYVYRYAIYTPSNRQPVPNTEHIFSSRIYNALTLSLLLIYLTGFANMSLQYTPVFDKPMPALGQTLQRLRPSSPDSPSDPHASTRAMTHRIRRLGPEVDTPSTIQLESLDISGLGSRQTALHATVLLHQDLLNCDATKVEDRRCVQLPPPQLYLEGHTLLVHNPLLHLQ